ncbi:MAG: 4-deoxy-4-formamido-L-arabinose-phosphoundecaprenol deformylase [Thermoanaerobaculia bacterium]|nr:4-deoxy-4-formamido-L-arabinose-phosphoundecaprenol deformylase [Thermoanaerobaculia bacterium]
MRVGLRVDVDTLRGTLRGVPALCQTLARFGVQATFFFSVGPDNMGRHLWRLVRPQFFLKMLRTRAAKLYGWDIVLRGTLFPGPLIGERAAGVIREVAASGHEVGLHAWDHHAWQSRVERMDRGQVADHLGRGMQLLEKILGAAPSCSAAPAWRCTETVLAVKKNFPFTYNSDCRGTAPFLPLLADGTTAQLQLPCTLPTFDERVGRDGVTAERYYDELLEALEPAAFNVLTIHAEVEGIASRESFAAFLEKAIARGYRFVPLLELAAEQEAPPLMPLVRREIPGREGWLSWQGVS